MTSITPASWITRLARAGRRAQGARKSRARSARKIGAFSVPLLAACALLAGCGTTHATASGSAGAARSSAPATATAAPAATAPSSATATPVPTVTGGAVVAGEPACAGWPSNAPHGTLTALFDAVAVERCVTGYQEGPGNVEWQTATLEKATRNLTPLLDALLQPPTERRPDTVCPYLTMIPPQVVLISSTGKQLIPRIPLNGCSIVESQFLTALATLTWQPVSVRLLAKVSGAQPGTATVEPRSPKTIQTLPAAAPERPATAS